MNRVSVEICNKLGLHARAAAKLVALASEFESEVWLELGETRADATSIMAVMMLAAGPGTPVTIAARGPDEGEALARISALIEDRFGENE